jgi:hypothetical protein
VRYSLTILFIAILALMIAVTVRASFDRSIIEALNQLLPDPWFQATICDAYCGFLTFYVWVAYRERRRWKRIVWFVVIMPLGNIAMAIYVLIQIATRRADLTWHDFFAHQND